MLAWIVSDKVLIVYSQPLTLNPANTGHSPNAVSMLGQRRRRCANIETALGECPVLAGKALITVITIFSRFISLSN